MANPKLALIPSAYKAGKLYSPLPTNGDGDFTFTRNSTATRVNKDGLIEEVAINTPRLDYSDGGCPSLLLEPSRTNLCIQSEDFANSAWTKTNVDIETADIVSPSGELNATKMTINSASQPRRIFDAVSTTIGEDYTISLYVKKGNTDSIFFITTSGSLNATFNLATLIATNGSIKDVGNEWYRVSATFNASVATEVPQIVLGNIDSVGDFQYIYGAQIEEGSNATSYIPTNGSIATRVADLCGGSGDANLFNDNEGVLYVETGVRVDDGLISLNDGSTSNRICLFLNETNKTIRAIVSNGAVSQVDSTYTSPTSISDNVKVAIKYKENDFALWVNGIEVLTDSSGLTPSGLSRCDFSVNGILPFYGKCKEVRYYDTALTDAELITLTTI